MGKRAQLILGTVIVAGLIWLVLPPSEPSYQGKRLTVWVEQYETNRWPLDKEAESAIRQFGPAAPPIFLKLMTTRESPLILKLLARIPNQVGKTLHIQSAGGYRKAVDDRRILGAYGFSALGSNAAPYVPSLIALLHDPNDRVRYLAVFTLRCLGPIAAEALPSLIPCLNDLDFTIQDDAVISLGTLQQQPERVVPLLTNFLGTYHTNVILASDAIHAIGSFGPQARLAIPTLLPYLNDREEGIRVEATNALQKIDLGRSMKKKR